MRSIQTLSTAALVSAGLVCSAGAQTKITYGSWAPENGPAAIAANAFFEKVTKQTKGSLISSPSTTASWSTFGPPSRA